MFHAWSSAHYVFPLPEGHRFPIAKYELLRTGVIAERIARGEHLHDPRRVDRDLLLLVHSAQYVDDFTNGALTSAAVRRTGFPWSEQLVERSYRAVGGTCEAARAALGHGVAMNLAGGTHHAFPEHGEGFCVFNDVAVAIRMLQHEHLIRRAAIVDLDVHQGNGTHAIFTGDRDVFTFSMHASRNYPFRKVPGRLDIGLADGTGDHEYLSLLEEALPRVIAESAADIVFFLAGADAHQGDQLGRLALSFGALARRDYLVIERCREVGLPVVVVVAGGYGACVEDTVRIHLATARIASQFA